MMPRSITCQSGPCGKENFFRAEGGCLCQVCALPYRDHPYCSHSELPESMQGSSVSREYDLHVLCGGDHVKL